MQLKQPGQAVGTNRKMCMYGRRKGEEVVSIVCIRRRWRVRRRAQLLKAKEVHGGGTRDRRVEGCSRKAAWCVYLFYAMPAVLPFGAVL